MKLSVFAGVISFSAILLSFAVAEETQNLTTAPRISDDEWINVLNDNYLNQFGNLFTGKSSGHSSSGKSSGSRSKSSYYSSSKSKSYSYSYKNSGYST